MAALTHALTQEVVKQVFSSGCFSVRIKISRLYLLIKQTSTSLNCSPTELFAARSRSHKIPVRGQKDFFPDDSEEQRQRLEQSLTEHWSLVSEERVEKL